MATYTYDPAESRDLDWMRGVVDDTAGCTYPSSGTGTGAEYPDEVYANAITEQGDKHRAAVHIIDRLLARYARRESQFSGGQGQMQATWANRIAGLQAARLGILQTGPLSTAQYTTGTQTVDYARDPYSHPPDYLAPPEM